MVKTSSSNIKIIRLPKIIKIFERRISDTKIEATIWQFLAGSQTEFASRIRFILNRDALDVNPDGRIDFTDGIIIGRSQAYLSHSNIDPYDINQDGIVNNKDNKT